MYDMYEGIVFWLCLFINSFFLLILCFFVKINIIRIVVVIKKYCMIINKIKESDILLNVKFNLKVDKKN